MSEKNRHISSLVNKKGTPVEVTNDNRLKVSLTGETVVGSSTITGSARTPNMIRPVNAGTIAPLVYSFSIANVGAANGVILGQTIKPGESLNFDPGINNYYVANTIAYNGTGTELVIIYNS
jgi:hypothetical protein